MQSKLGAKPARQVVQATTVSATYVSRVSSRTIIHFLCAASTANPSGPPITAQMVYSASSVLLEKFQIACFRQAVLSVRQENIARTDPAAFSVIRSAQQHGAVEEQAAASHARRAPNPMKIALGAEVAVWGCSVLMVLPVLRVHRRHLCECRTTGFWKLLWQQCVLAMYRICFRWRPCVWLARQACMR